MTRYLGGNEILNTKNNEFNSGFNQSETSPANAHAHCDVFQARMSWQEMVKLNKGSIFVITETQFAIQSQVM